ncbi:MAG TPA: hypothetical protein VEO00_06125 [Actinomycetota bacterium]|nr:hypothetical protein [Actinomycetota bacterium]
MTDENSTEELYRHRHDLGEWSSEPEEIEVRSSKTEVVSFRLPSGELDVLEDAAQRAAESLSEYIRKAVALRLHGLPIGPSVEVTSGAERLTIRSHIVVSSRRDAPDSFVPDLPPLTVANT